MRVTNLNASGYGIGIDFADALSAGRVAARIASITPGDATTGDLYFQTRVSSALSTKMYIKSDGNVGIGTTAPAELLDVRGVSGLTGATPVTLRLQSTSDGDWTNNSIYSRLDFANSDTNGNIGPGTKARIAAYVNDTGRVGSGGDAGLQFFTAGASLAPRMTIDAVGNVGIGTTSPGTRLTVDGIGRFTSDTGGWGSGPWAMEIGRDATYGYLGSYDRSASTYKPMYLFASEILLNGGGEGNVGIGTTNPGSGSTFTGAATKLDVVGDIHITRAGSRIWFGDVANANPFFIGEGTLAQSGTDTDYMVIEPRNRLAIQSTAYTTRVGIGYNDSGQTATLAVNGNVGIGTTSPEYKLKVAGTLGASGITTLSNQLYLTGGWSQNGAPYHAALQIYGTYPSMEFRSSTSNSVWLYHMSANGFMNWYNDPGSKDTANWSNMMQLSPGGSLNVVGVLTKGSGSFLIDHPLDPLNKVLRHSFVESPDMKNIYDGIATLNEKGEITVELPNYFEALNENFRYQITPVGKPVLLYVKEEIKDNKFVIAGGESGMKVSWQVTGVRKDAFAKKYPVVVEEEKGFVNTQKGVYLHPDSFPAQNMKS